MKKLSYISVLLFTLFIFTNGVYAACPLGPDVTKDLYGVLKVIRIAAPLLVIAFTIFESIQAITKGDASADLKKVAIRFGKRSIYAVLLFFLPIIIDQFMQMANVWGEGGTCDIEHAEENGTEDNTLNNNQTEPTTSSTTTTKKADAKACEDYRNEQEGCPRIAENGDQCQEIGSKTTGTWRCIKYAGSTSTAKTTTAPVSCKGLDLDTCNRVNNCSWQGDVLNGYCADLSSTTTKGTTVKVKTCEDYRNPNDGCPPTAENGDKCQGVGSGQTWRCIKR